MSRFLILFIVAFFAVPLILTRGSCAQEGEFSISRARYKQKLEGFWLGQCIANWTGLVTEMDKVGGEGDRGKFYTRDDWGKHDQPAFWSDKPSHLSPTIDWVFESPGQVWGADDDTDIEYIYQHLLHQHRTSYLTGEQIRDGWLKHIYADENTPFTKDGKRENFLWVSNQRAHDLMRLKRLIPPATSDPENNPDFDMIDAQLTTEIFGLFAPTRPDVALKMAHLPIRTTARENGAWAAEFYVVMYSLASRVEQELSAKEQISWMADTARKRIPNNSYTAKMYDFVKRQHALGIRWEQTRDNVYRRYCVEQKDGYDIPARNIYANGGFASGINFASSIISLLYGEGDYQRTVKIAVLCGWDSDNPAATWGGLLGFMHGIDGIEKSFGRKFANKFNIHRTRGNFPNDGVDTFSSMAERGLEIVDRTVTQELNGKIDLDENVWLIPKIELDVEAAK